MEVGDMKKIGIVTLNGYDNYGNRLQNYALQEVLKGYNYEVETIVIEEHSQRENMSRLKKIRSLKGLFRAIKLRTFNRKTYNLKKIRLDKFTEFSTRYIYEVKYIVTDVNNLSSDCDLTNDYDYFVVGSDQVWNPNFVQSEDFFFLRFTCKRKRIAYAPSFGVAEIPEKYKETYRIFLKEMEHISVREDAGAKIIKQLIDFDAPVLVDPTLLLSKEQWLKITEQAQNKTPKKYLLTYFLGGLPAKFNNQIRDLATKNKLTIINIGDTHDGPSQFLDYIKDCSVLCTDSFHGAVFSILFEKPFIIYPREGSISMYSRIDTLLDKFGLHSRKIENIKSSTDAFDVDYSHVPIILENEKKKSHKYLKNALQVTDGKPYES